MIKTVLIVLFCVSLVFCQKQWFLEKQTSFPVCTTRYLDENAQTYKAIEIGYLDQFIDIGKLPKELYYPMKILVNTGHLTIGSLVVYTQDGIKKTDHELYASGKDVVMVMSPYHIWNGAVSAVVKWIVRGWHAEEKALPATQRHLEDFDYEWMTELCDKVGEGRLFNTVLSGSDILVTFIKGHLKLYVNHTLKYDKMMTSEQFARVATYFKRSAFVSTQDDTLKKPISK